MNEIIGKLIRLFYEHQTGQGWCLNIFGRPHLEYVPVKLEELGTNDLLIGQKVTETVTKTGEKDVTYYRYRTREYTEGTTKYKWSNSKTDEALLKEGYKLTGKTR